MEPQHLQQKVFEFFALVLSFLVGHVHSNPGNAVQFLAKKKVFNAEGEEGLQIIGLKDIPAAYPFNPHQCPEAYDSGCLLRHIRTSNNLVVYAELLGFHNRPYLRSLLSQILGRIPRKSPSRNPTPTWASLRDTISRMRIFLQASISGLKSSDRPRNAALVVKFQQGLEDLNDIDDRAIECAKYSPLP